MKLLKVLSIYLVKDFTTTDPAMKVDIDGEISLETPIDIEVIPNAIQLLTVNDL